jgi:periplasmic copper chaperone A
MFAMILTSVSIVAATAQAGSESLKITDAWVPAAEKSGGDVPLLMTIRNDSSSPDALMRVRCAAANFSEKHTVDRGEGAPAMRAIASIPLAADSTITLKRDGYHVMLLQTRQLGIGDRFTCLIDFQKAGTIEREVQVR